MGIRGEFAAPSHRAKTTDLEFVDLFESLGPHEMARKTKGSLRVIFRRRKLIEQKLGRSINAPGPYSKALHYKRPEYPQRYFLELKNGLGIVASDCHFWPSLPESTAFRALRLFTKELAPDFFVWNGDVLDFPSISRWPVSTWTDWESRPKVADEIEYSQERTTEISKLLPRRCKRLWTLGNHDARYESIIANRIPEFARLHGVHLKDHFPGWEPCMAVWINSEEKRKATVIKHFFRRGIHADHNNIMYAGTHMITGDTHALSVKHLADYNGPTFGAQTGMIAEPYGPQFVNYTWDNPVNWGSGFLVLEYDNYHLLWPQPVHVIEPGKVSFKGKVYRV